MAEGKSQKKTPESLGREERRGRRASAESESARTARGELVRLTIAVPADLALRIKVEALNAGGITLSQLVVPVLEERFGRD